MEERRATASWLLVTMIAVAILAASSAVAAADVGAQPAPPDTNVLCVSKCGTCPTVCSSPPPPDSSSSSSSSGYNPVLSPPKGSAGGSSSSPSAPLAKGGRPGGSSNYYYFFTSGGSSRPSCASPTAYAAVLMSFLSLVAVFSP